jgi:hypothetical protein
MQLSTAQSTYFEHMRRFKAARERRAAALATLRSACKEMLAADAAAGALTLVPLADTVGAAMRAVQETHRSLLFAASDLDDAAVAAKMTPVERAAAAAEAA